MKDYAPKGMQILEESLQMMVFTVRFDLLSVP